MAALASYARQAEDESLLKIAMRIQGRAVRRAGELLREIDARGGDRTKSVAADTFGPATISQRDAAEAAGMSKRQQVTAVRVANVPAEDFEAVIESAKPPTITALAAAGRKPRRKSQSKPPPRVQQLRPTPPAEDSLNPEEADRWVRSLAAYVRGAFLNPPPGIRACLKGAMARASPKNVRVLAAVADFLAKLKEAAPAGHVEAKKKEGKRK